MTDTKDTNPKDLAGATRLDPGLFPDTAVWYGAWAMTEGDCKYGSYNYREKGVQAHVYHAALRRHLAKWWNGEWADPDTAVPHLASVLACAGILIDAVCCHKLNDDRPVRVPSMDDVQRAIQTGTAQLHATYPIRAPRSLENPHQTKKDKLS